MLSASKVKRVRRWGSPAWDQQSWRSQVRPANNWVTAVTDTFWLHNSLQTTAFSTDLRSGQFLAHSLSDIIISPKMGWLPWSSGDSNKNEASDGGRIAPDRTSRARCWEGRDRFFACLDKNDILDGIKDDKKARQKCASEVAEFEAACSQSWVRTTGPLIGSPGLQVFVVS